MMALQWSLFLVIVAAMTQNVSGMTAIRSQYNRGGRIKGETTNELERHLQVDEQRATKKHAGNILHTLDQVVRSMNFFPTFFVCYRLLMLFGPSRLSLS
jgi:hypothetical protein